MEVIISNLGSYFKNKKIFIAGGTGLIGATLSNKLTNLNANVISASIDSKKRAELVLNKPKIFRYIDFRNINECKRYIRNSDIVVNLMGVRESTQLGISRSASAFSAFLVCNTNIIEATCLNKVGNYLFCGSINQYPPISIRKEDDVWKGLPAAQDRYVGMAKRIGEIQAEAYSNQYNWKAVKIVRPSNVYGPFDNFNPETAHVIPSLIYKVINQSNGILNVAGDGSAIRDFIYVDDVVDGILMALKSKIINTPINLGSGKGTSIKNLVKIIKNNIPNKNLRVNWDTSKPRGDKKRVLDIARAKKLINFIPKTQLNDGIKKTIEWYLANKMIGYRLGRTYDKKYK